MKVVLFGASGMIGSRALKELVARGHSVVAVVRDASKVPVSAQVTVVTGDLLDAKFVASVVRGADAVISAYSPGTGKDLDKLMIASTESLLAGVKEGGVKRLIVVGGAGSLFVAPGVRLVDIPQFPAEYKDIARAHHEALKILEKADLDWTYFSPAGVIQPGERTGKFRLDTTNVVADEKGSSTISAEDYAIALVDELEQPKHIRQQFTIGY